MRLISLPFPGLRLPDVIRSLWELQARATGRGPLFALLHKALSSENPTIRLQMLVVLRLAGDLFLEVQLPSAARVVYSGFQLCKQPPALPPLLRGDRFQTRRVRRPGPGR